MNDHFGSGDAQTQSTNDEAHLQEQPWTDDVDEEERDDLPEAILKKIVCLLYLYLVFFGWVGR